MKYPVVKVTGLHGEFMAYQAMVNDIPLFVDKALADLHPIGPEAYIANAIEEELKCHAGY